MKLFAKVPFTRRRMKQLIVCFKEVYFVYIIYDTINIVCLGEVYFVYIIYDTIGEVYF